MCAGGCLDLRDARACEVRAESAAAAVAIRSGHGTHRSGAGRADLSQLHPSRARGREVPDRRHRGVVRLRSVPVLAGGAVARYHDGNVERARADQRARRAADCACRAPLAAVVAGHLRLASGRVLHDDVPGRRRVPAGDVGRRILRAPDRRRLGSRRSDHSSSRARRWCCSTCSRRLHCAAMRAFSSASTSTATSTTIASSGCASSAPCRQGTEIDVRRTALHAIAQIFSSPAGILFLLDEPGRRFVPVASWPQQLEAQPALPEMFSDEDLPRFLDRTHWIIDLQEYRRSPDMYENVTLPRWILDNPEIRILSPLMQLDRMVGFVMLYSAAAAVRADVRRPRPSENRGRARGDAPGAARGGPQARRERAVRGLQPPHGFHDARPEELGGAAAAGGDERGASQAQSAIHRGRHRNDRQHGRAHDAADRTAAARLGRLALVGGPAGRAGARRGHPLQRSRSRAGAGGRRPLPA